MADAPAGVESMASASAAGASVAGASGAGASGAGALAANGSFSLSGISSMPASLGRVLVALFTLQPSVTARTQAAAAVALQLSW